MDILKAACPLATTAGPPLEGATNILPPLGVVLHPLLP